MNRGLVSAVLLLVPALSAAGMFTEQQHIAKPVPERFSVCFNHSCRTVLNDSLTSQEWQHVTEPLQVPAPSPAVERAALARVIASMEETVGRHTGTDRDRGRNLAGFGRPGQLDCIDEASNTHTYLVMLENAGLLHHHRVMGNATRFGLFVGMPHTTAVIEEAASGRRYAVDSWFRDNGEPPYIDTLEKWRAGGEPVTDEQ